jgi:hypothetical protein
MKVYNDPLTKEITQRPGLANDHCENGGVMTMEELKEELKMTNK